MSEGGTQYDLKVGLDSSAAKPGVESLQSGLVKTGEEADRVQAKLDAVASTAARLGISARSVAGSVSSVATASSTLSTSVSTAQTSVAAASASTDRLASSVASADASIAKSTGSLGSMGTGLETVASGATTAAASTETLMSASEGLAASLRTAAEGVGLLGKETLLGSESALSYIRTMQQLSAELQLDIQAEREGTAAIAARKQGLLEMESLVKAGITAEDGLAGAVLNEFRAWQQLTGALEKVRSDRAAETAAADAATAAERKLQQVLVELRTSTNQTGDRVAAARQGAAAEAALNQQLEIQAQLLAAGVAEMNERGRLVVIDQQGAAAIREEVIALEDQRAVLAQVRAEQEATLGKASSGAGLLSRAIGEIGTALKYMAVYGGIIELIQGFKEAVAAAIEFESALIRLRTLVGASAQEVQSVREAIHGISLETGQSAAENAKAAFAIESSGLRGQAALDALSASAKGAAIGLGDQTTVARGAVAAMTAYGAGNLTAKQALDVYIATAREGNTTVDSLVGAFARVTGVAAAVGVKFGDLGGSIAAFTRVGVSAQEAATGLSGILSALEVKGAKSANEALKTVGLSVASLRTEIQQKGLAAALLDLVQRFDGNNDALAKVVPNIRALRDILSTAGSQGEEYVGIQDRVNASIGHATDEAYALVKADPAFVFKQMKAAVEEASLQIVSGLLPQLVQLAEEIRGAVQSGDLQAWASGIAGAFRVVMLITNALGLVLGNLPIVLGAYAAFALSAAGANATLTVSETTLTAGMFAFAESAAAADAAEFALVTQTAGLSAGMMAYAGSLTVAEAAEIDLAASSTGLLASIESLTAAIEANPFGAAAAAVLVLLGVLNHFITTSKDSDKAFLNEVAAANDNAVALAKLAKQYDVLAVSKKAALGASGVGLITGPAKVSAGAVDNSAIVLRDSGADNFLGQLNAINLAYAKATEAAGTNKVALEAAKIARDRSTAALEGETRALVENSKAAIENEKSKTGQIQNLLDTAKRRLDVAQGAADQLAASGSESYKKAYGPEIQSNLRAAKSDVDNLAKSLQLHNDRITTSTKAVAALETELDLQTASQRVSTGETQKAAKSVENFHDWIKKQIDVKNEEARGTLAQAAAQLVGDEAVRQAVILEQQNKAVIEATAKAKKDKTTLTKEEELGIRSSIRALSDAQVVERQMAALRQQRISDDQAIVDGEAKIQDALAGTTINSTLASAAFRGEQEARKLGLVQIVAGVELLSQEGQAWKAHAVAVAEDRIEIERRVTSIKAAYEQSVALRAAEAELQDAINRTTVASQANALALKIEKDQRAQNAIAGLPLAASIKLTDERYQRESDTLAKHTQALRLDAEAEKQRDQLSAQFSDWQANVDAVKAYGSGLAGILEKYGLLGHAQEDLQIKMEVTAALNRKDNKLTEDELTAQITKQHQLIDEIRKTWADAEIQQWLEEPFREAWSTISSNFLSTLNDALVTGQADWTSFWQSALKTALQYIEQWLVRWIAAQRLAQAAAAETAAVNEAAGASGGGGGGGGGVGVGTLGAIGSGYQWFMGTGWGHAIMGNPMTGGNGFGGGAGSGAAGAAGFALVAAVIINWLETKGTPRARSDINFGGSQGISIGSGSFNQQGANPGDAKRNVNQVLAAATGIIAEVRDFIKSLGGSIDLTQAMSGTESITKKGQGKNTHWIVTTVTGMVQDFGRDYDAAMQFALVQAIKATPTVGLSPEVQAAIKGSVAKTMDDLNKDIAVGMDALHARLGDQGSQVYDKWQAAQQEIDAATKLGIATDALIAARDRELASMKNSVLGIDTSVADNLAALVSYKSGIDEVTRSINASATQALGMTLDEAQAYLAKYQGLLDQYHQTAPTGNIHDGTFEPGKWVDAMGNVADDATAEILSKLGPLKQALAKYADELGKLPQQLSEQEVSMAVFNQLYQYLQGSQKYEAQRVEFARMKVDLEFQAIKMQLVALDMWDKYAGMWTDAYNAAMHDAAKRPNAGHGGGGKNTDKQDFLDQLKADTRLGLPAGVQAVLELGDKLAEMAKKAKELKVSEDQLRAARQALIDQTKKAILDPVRQYLGPGDGGTYGQSQWQTKAGDIEKTFDDARAANQKLLEETGQRAIAFWKLNQAELRALNGLAEDAIASLNLPMEQTRQQVKGLGDTVSFLRDSAAKGAITAGRLNDVIGQLGAQATQNLLGQAADLLEQEGKFDDADKARRQADELNFQLQVLQFNFLLDSYEALGILSDEQKGKLEALRAEINDPANQPDFTKPAPQRPQAQQSTDDPWQQASQLVDTITAQIKEWNQLSLGPAAKGAQDLKDKMADLTAQEQKLAWTGGQLSGAMAQLQAAYQVAVNKFVSDTISGLLPVPQVVKDAQDLRDKLDDAHAALVTLGASADQFAQLASAGQAAVEDFVDKTLQGWEDLGKNPLQIQLRDLLKQLGDAHAALVKLGVSAQDMARFEAARVDALNDFWKQATSGLTTFLHELQHNDPRTSSADQFTTSRDHFRDLLARAQAGDLDALSQLEQAGRDYQSAAQSFLGAGVGSGSVVDEITHAIQALTGSNPLLSGTDNPIVDHIQESNDLLKAIRDNTAGSPPSGTHITAPVSESLAAPSQPSTASPARASAPSPAAASVVAGDHEGSGYGPELLAVLQRLEEIERRRQDHEQEKQKKVTEEKARRATVAISEAQERARLAAAIEALTATVGTLAKKVDSLKPLAGG